jgi:L-cysteate sulfo-lyase
MLLERGERRVTIARRVPTQDIPMVSRESAAQRKSHIITQRLLFRPGTASRSGRRQAGLAMSSGRLSWSAFTSHTGVHLPHRSSPPTPEYEISGNAFLNRLFGAHLHDVPWIGDRNSAIQVLGDRLREEGRRPYFVPYGVSNALGAVAYASTIAEIAVQASAAGFHPSAIVHCTGSAGTQAGLVVGASIALKGVRVVGIDIDAEPEQVRADVVKYAKAAADLLETSFNAADVEVVAGHAGPAYGAPHDATIEAIKLAGALEALVLDPVYSGKALAGLIALVRAGRWKPDDAVVFVHTGGAPVLFAYRSALDI